MSRKIEDLVPEMQEKLKMFAVRMAEAGIPWMITCTFRSQEEQNVLWEKGRTTPGPKVTWTRASRHTQRTAFDIAILSQGKPVWDTKISVNGDDIPDYQQAGEIGEMVGLTWGGRFKDLKGKPTPDHCHFEDSGGPVDGKNYQQSTLG